MSYNILKAKFKLPYDMCEWKRKNKSFNGKFIFQMSLPGLHGLSNEKSKLISIDSSVSVWLLFEMNFIDFLNEIFFIISRVEFFFFFTTDIG